MRLSKGLQNYHEQSKELREYLLMKKTTDSINEICAFKVGYEAPEHKVRYGLNLFTKEQRN